METEQTTRPGEEAAPVGPFVHLHTYLNGMRHWAALTAEGEPRPVQVQFLELQREGIAGPSRVLNWAALTAEGEPRPVHVQFLELQREGIAGLSRVLNALVQELYPLHHAMRHPRQVPGMVTGWHLQHEQTNRETAWNVNAGAIPPHRGNAFTLEQLKSRTNYGEVYSRAVRQMTYTVQVPHVVTEEEARQFAERLGEVPLKVGGISLQGAPDPPANGVANEGWRHWAEVFGLDVLGPEMRDLLQPAKATAEQIGRHWAEVYAAEVMDALGDEPDAERVAAFETLRAGVEAHGIGTAEGAPALERMAKETQGKEVWAAFNRVTGYLNTLLDQLATEYSEEGESSAPEERLNWKVSTSAFVHIFNKMAALGYFDLPSKGGKKGDPNNAQFARILLRAFDIRGKDQQPMKSERLRERLSGAGSQLMDEKQAKFQFPETKEL